MTPPVLQIDRVTRRYRLPRERLFGEVPMLAAVDGVSLQVGRGEVLGIVGESGSGKSTLGRLAMAFETPDEGTVRFEGDDLNALAAPELRRRRRGFQMVFQDPFGSLDPRRPIGWSVGEPMLGLPGIDRSARETRVADVLDLVRLRRADMEKFPHEFSGGQRQRIAIARAIVTRPKLIVADEPVASLDVSVQAQILNLFMDLQEELDLSMLFVSHDLAIVASLCDRVAVMQKGRIVETAATRAIVTQPQHAYTRALFEAADYHI